MELQALCVVFSVQTSAFSSLTIKEHTVDRERSRPTAKI